MGLRVLFWLNHPDLAPEASIKYRKTDPPPFIFPLLAERCCLTTGIYFVAYVWGGGAVNAVWSPKDANMETKTETQAQTGDRALKREAVLLQIWLQNSEK